MKFRHAAIALLIIVGSACGPDPAAGKIKLRYMAWGNPEQLALEEDLCRRFNEANPDVYVQFIRVPGSAYANKSVVMLASNTAPDVLRIDHYNFANLQKKKFFLDLTPYAQSDPAWNPADFFPQTTEECAVDGRIFGLNVLFGGIVIYYNKSMFAKAGLEDPYDLWKKGKWTTDAFLASAIELTKQDDKKRYSQFGVSIPTFPNWVPLLRAFGGDFVDETYSRSKIDEEKAVAGLRFIADLRFKNHCAPTSSQAANSAFTFEGGKMGMVFDWMGMTPRYRNTIKDFDWDVVPVPAGPAGGSTIVKGNQLCIPANCANPKEAWRFARFITSPEIERVLYVQNRRCFPTRQGVATSKDFLETTQAPKQIHIFLDAVRGGKPLPINDRWGEWTVAMNNELDALWTGTQRDPKVAAAKAAAAVNKVLSEEPGW